MNNQKSTPKLENLCLCAIVRDEEINPAGGIQDFLDCTLPYVGSAVIIDTGSSDGTRDILEESMEKYPHLRVYDEKFQGYAEARNLSLEKARQFFRGSYALVLDADERLFQQDFTILQQELSKRPKALNLRKLVIYYGNNFMDTTSHNPLCFSLQQDFHYKNTSGYAMEYLFGSKSKLDFLWSRAHIKHFKPEARFVSSKTKWHLDLSDPQNQNQIQHPDFSNWKKINPRRAEWPQAQNA